MDRRELDNRFTHHKPNDLQIQVYKKIRETAKEFAIYLNEVCPEGREKSLAMTNLEQTVMWANAGIARHS